MQLSQAQEKKLRQFIKKNLTPPMACPVCHNANWSFSDKIFECREFAEGKLQLGSGSIAPFVLMRCEHCGYTLFFNAISIGLVERHEGKEREQKET